VGESTCKKVISPLKKGLSVISQVTVMGSSSYSSSSKSANKPIFLIGHQSRIERSIAEASKSNYQRTIELIDICAGENSLDEETRSSFILKQAILFQQNGDVHNAYEALELYKNSTQQQYNTEYYICKGKLISQDSSDPDRLSEYLDLVEQKDLFRNTDSKKELSSLYWRASVLWYTQDMQKSDFYLSTHRGFIETGSYQNAHNHQLIGLSSIISLAQEGISNKYLINKSFDALIQSFGEYIEIENFRWLNKCVASNLLMMALIDYLAKLPIRFYKKIFYVRKLFSLYEIEHNDEAISEIISVIKKVFPEIFEILFTKNISIVIRKHALSEVLREIYLEVEYEFVDTTSSQTVDTVALYKRLVS